MADARDYFANVFKNLDTWAAIFNVFGFCGDLLSYGSEFGTDVAKAAPKVGKFVSKNIDDTPKVVEAISQVSKQISKNDDILPALAKSLDVKTVDKIADSLQSTKNITKADYSKSLDILEAAGKKVDSSKDLLATLNSIDAERVSALIKRCGCDPNELRKAFENRGKDKILKAIEKCGDDNVDLILELANGSNLVSFEKMEFILKTPDGTLLWLETGNQDRGLKHLLKHKSQFSHPDYGIAEDEIKPLLYKLLSDVKPDEILSRPGKGNHIEYSAIYTYNSKQYLVAYGDNGYIVTFHPYTP